MPRPKQAFKKHTFNLREGDFEFLQAVANSRGLDGATVIRKIISSAVDKIRARNGSEEIDLND